MSPKRNATFAWSTVPEPTRTSRALLFGRPQPFALEAVLGQWPDCEPTGIPNLGQPRKGGQRRFELPGADVQSESWRSTVAPGTSVEEMSSIMVPGVASSRQSRPQVVHSTAPAWPGGRQLTSRPKGPVRRTNPARLGTGQFCDGVSGGNDITCGPHRPVMYMARVCVAVYRDFVAAPGHLLRNVRISGGHLAQHEEGRPPNQARPWRPGTGLSRRSKAVVEREG